MKNTIIFGNNSSFKQKETLVFFINENFDLKLENKIFSGSNLNKIKFF